MVFVLDKRKKPLMPCVEKRARLLLNKGKAVVHKIFPFTIRLKDRLVSESAVQPLRLKLDPGSKVTGMAILRVHEDKSTAIFLGEIHHKTGIKDSLKSRADQRGSRRTRHTRYRAKRYAYRKRKKGWLPPSLEARVNQTLTTVFKLRSFLPIVAISTEHVKFDTQLMNNPGIQGIEYQQGELWGYEVKEYLLEKYERTCQYCKGKRNDPILEVEHMTSKARGGTDRLINLTIACHTCNDEKGTRSAEEYGHPEVRKQAFVPMRDAAMMNATRWRLFRSLKDTGLPVECGTGARTKKQRIEHDLPKEHYYDACCVGTSTPSSLSIKTDFVNVWKATGRGNRQMCNTNKKGFPISHRTRTKSYFGFQTGDLVKANAPKGKYMGSWSGRVACRATGYFDIKNSAGKRICESVSYKNVTVLQRAAGWQFEKKERAHSSP